MKTLVDRWRAMRSMLRFLMTRRKVRRRMKEVLFVD